MAKKRPSRAELALVYRMRIEFEEIEASIGRMIHLPDTLTLTKLDRVVQVVMGTGNSCLQAWKIAGLRYGVRDPD